MKPVKEQEWETRTGLSSESYDNSRRRGITKLYHQLIKYNIETQIEKILIIGKQRKLTKKEEVNLIRIDQLITKILLKSERRINSHPIPSLISKHFPNSSPINYLLSSFLQKTSIHLLHSRTNQSQQNMDTVPSQFPPPHFPPPSFSPPQAKKQKVQTETSSIIKAITNLIVERWTGSP